MITNRAAVVGALFCACTTYGAGFQVLEQGAANMGSALAGSTANANSDASAAFWNPSTVFFTNQKVGELKMEAGATFILSSFRFYDEGSSVTGNDGGNAGQLAAIPNFFATYRITEDIAITLATTSTYGLATNYKDGWIGRYQGIKSDMMTMDFNPTITYKATDWLAFHAGATAQWMHAELTQAMRLAPTVDGLVSMTAADWSAGANAGFAIKYAENGRIGFSWRSEVSQKLSGNMTVNNNYVSPVSADVCLPQTFAVGVYQRLWGALSDFAVMADYEYTCWTSFDALVIKNPDTGGVISNTPENWANVSRVSVGMHYYISDEWTFRMGLAYDESPIKSAKDRTVRIPCSDRYWIAGGIGYKYENFSLDLSYMYIMFPDDSPVDSPTIKGTLEGRAHVISIMAGMSF